MTALIRSCRPIVIFLALSAACADPSPGGPKTDAGPDGSASPDGSANPDGSTSVGVRASLDTYVATFCSVTRTCCAADAFPTTALGDCEAEVRRQQDLDILAA